MYLDTRTFHVLLLQRDRCKQTGYVAAMLVSGRSYGSAADEYLLRLDQ
mgnify:CR=1 FL=1